MEREKEKKVWEGKGSEWKGKRKRRGGKGREVKWRGGSDQEGSGRIGI